MANQFSIARILTAFIAMVWLLCGASSASAVVATKTIAVRVFVDEEEPRRDEYWKQVIGRRLDQASTILGGYGSIRFSITKFGTWDSDDNQFDFAQSLKEFETETKPAPAELAIGFTSQYRFKKGRSNLGGTRGPMRKHVLIREGSPKVHEVERLEVLVHELAHYLGAAHTGDQSSVMRPILGDGQSRAKAFRIRLDQPNATVVRLVSSEMARRNVTNMHQLTMQTKVSVRDQYAILAKDFPEDPVAKRYVQIMDKSIQVSVAIRQRQIQAAAAAKTREAMRKAQPTKRD